MSEVETPDEKLARLRERLSTEQRHFCELFLKTCDAHEAYKTAYRNDAARASTADKLLGRWYIQDYLQALAGSVGVDDTLITKGEVVAHLATILRDENEEAKDRIAAAKVVSTVRGFGVKRVEHTGKDGGPIKSEGGLNPDQLLQLRRDFLGIDPEPKEESQ